MQDRIEAKFKGQKGVIQYSGKYTIKSNTLLAFSDNRFTDGFRVVPFSDLTDGQIIALSSFEGKTRIRQSFIGIFIPNN